jgi:CelD/BcsL family acetyltransferase involved in cellulose biosynthesis
MRTTIVPASELSEDHKQQWCAIQEADPQLQGPCFRPELFTTLGCFRSDVFVAILEDGPGTLGFLPFLRDAHGRLAKPVPMCDYQAIISRNRQPWDVVGALRKCHVKAWDFEHLIGLDVLKPQPEIRSTEDSGRIDLSGGVAPYLAGLQRQGRKLRRSLAQRTVLERDVGPVRFEPFCTNPAVLHAILDWKADRFNAGQAVPGWIAETLECLAGQKEGAVTGVLSALYAGEELVGGHFGLRCQGILHAWFAAFNSVYARYSAGLILLHEVVAHNDAFQCHTVDFGPGGEDYKRYFCNASFPTATGTIEVPSAFSLIRQSRRRLEERVRSCRWLFRGLRPVVRAARVLVRRSPR